MLSKGGLHKIAAEDIEYYDTQQDSGDFTYRDCGMWSSYVMKQLM
jgi:hypothetical protein